MKKPLKRKTNQFSTDGLMLNVASSLIRDFRSNLNEPQFCSELLSALQKNSITDVRRLAPELDCNDSIACFKATYQIQSVFKRYRFRNDIYSDEELEALTISKFLDVQRRLADQDLNTLFAIDNVILDLAASYVARVLGPYDDEEHRLLCRFGRKASVGIPARSACEAARWELPISGSRGQISWFDSEMSQIDCVQEYWTNQMKAKSLNKTSIYQETSSLKLTLVPKTFKSLRCIMPNTTIGSYMSYGLGEIMRKRLKREGYDIKSLQMRHRYLAQSSSKHGLLMTMDLSSASDTISVQLVKRLFPPDWFHILEQSRIGKVELPNGQHIESLTYCTMGVGYTFPLQTLVFLSLLKAIQAVYYGKDRRTISVYGDDMIFSSRMYSKVVHHFEKFGFMINLDKTYHEGEFRESCGGDYFRGVDVRPFQPRNGPVNVSKRAYEAILYKLVNTLLARWTEYEIGRTLDFLTSEIVSVTKKCKIVPHDYPDDSGIKCVTLASEFLARTVIARPKHVGHGRFRFSYLRFSPEKRKETRHGPYLWSALRGLSEQSDYWVTLDRRGHREIHKRQKIEKRLGINLYESPLEIIEDKPIRIIRGLHGIRHHRTTTYVTVSHSGRYECQTGFSCFEDRR